MYDYTAEAKQVWPRWPEPEYRYDLVDEPISDAVLVPVYGGRRRLTKVEFVKLLGLQVYAWVLQAAKVSAEIEVWVELLKLTTPDPDGPSISLDDEMTVQGLQSLAVVMAAAGVVGPTWLEGVLRG